MFIVNSKINNIWVWADLQVTEKSSSRQSSLCLLVLVSSFQQVPRMQSVFPWCLSCLGAGAGGGCVERGSPGPPIPNHSASGGEQEAVSEPLSQRVSRHRGGPAETGGWVVCSEGQQMSFGRFHVQTSNSTKHYFVFCFFFFLVN